jgi:membrane associated rhomboid family serine protease
MIELTKGVKQLLIINVVMFILAYLNMPFIESLVLFPIKSENFEIYQFVSYMFLHGSISHILFNMIGLVVFGPNIEGKFGTSRFIKMYLTMGIISGLSSIIFINNPVLGASGAVWGVMMLFALFNPNELLYLYFVIPVRAKFIITSFFLIELYLSIFGSDDSISHVAHIAGAIVGILFYLLKRSNKI